MKRSILIWMLCLFPAAPVFSHKQIDSLKAALHNSSTDSVRLNIYLDLANEYISNKSDSLLKYIELAEELAVETDDKHSIARLMWMRGVYLNETGQYSKAEKQHNKAIKYAGEINSALTLIRANNSLGSAFYERGKYELALTHYHRSLEIAEKLDKKNLQANALGNIGNIYQSQDKLDKAVEYYRTAAEIFKEIGNDYNYAVLQINIGNNYANRGSHANAAKYFQKALEYFKSVDNSYVMGKLMGNMGTLASNTGDQETAISYYFDAIKLQKKIDDQSGITLNLLNLARVYIEIGLADSAMFRLDQAERYAKRIQSISLLGEVYGEKSLVNEEVGRPERALRYYEQYRFLLDSLHNEETSQRIAEMDVKYNNQKREEAIELLKKEKKLRTTKLTQNKYIITAVSGGVILSLALAFLLFRVFRKKRRSNQLLQQTNEEIQYQKKIIEDKNKDITDSIHYAQNIQNTILPDDSFFKNLFPDSFVLYMPKEIVAGDLYWAEQVNDRRLFTCIDCISHGVPGAMMSVVAFNNINKCVNEMGVEQPKLVLEKLNNLILDALNNSNSSVKEGFNVALCSLREKTEGAVLEYAGARQNLWISGKYLERRFGKTYDNFFSDDKSATQLLEITADQKTLGTTADLKFRNHRLELEKGDVIYIFSDGYINQLGGKKDKKFQASGLKRLLIGQKQDGYSMEGQKEILQQTLSDWKKDFEQTDDVCVIGVRV